ncbi:hypothetical protein GCM10027062_43650 [Nocardioides hungaricus]
MLATDPRQLAADARSILACPSEVSLVIEGEPMVEDDTGLTDRFGTPTFLCRPDALVARAAAAHRSALLTVASGLGPRGGPERADTLTLAGRLERVGVEGCDCCQEVRHVVALRLNFVLLERAGRQHRVPLERFRGQEHELSRGHLQRSIEHANDCHQDELRQAVSTGTQTRPAELLGVRLAELTPAGVEVQWIDVDGAHRHVIEFPRVAGDLTELGDMLRHSLHAGIC